MADPKRSLSRSTIHITIIYLCLAGLLYGVDCVGGHGADGGREQTCELTAADFALSTRITALKGGLTY